METIPKGDCEKIGFIKKTHGVFGNVILEFDPLFESSLEDAGRFFIELDGLLVPFFIAEDGFRFKGANTAILNFDDVETEDYAKRMVGAAVYLFRDEIVHDTGNHQHVRFKNYMLVDKKAGEIGIIEQVDDYSGNLVLTVRFRGVEILVPLHADFILEIDDRQKTVRMDLPDGLLDE